MNLQKEIKSVEPNLQRISALVTSDVTISVAVLRTVNSPFFGLARRCETVDQAISLIGIKRLGTIVTGLILRNTVRGDSQRLATFWDTSSKRSYAMTHFARGIGIIDEDVAQSFGLFCDVGIPLLMLRFPGYEKTLNACYHEAEKKFTDLEQAEYRTDHALVGAIMARTWELMPTLCLAIRLHHDYAVLRDPKVPSDVTHLVAMNLVVEAAIQKFSFMKSLEWAKGSDAATYALALSDYEVEDWIERLADDLAACTI